MKSRFLFFIIISILAISFNFPSIRASSLKTFLDDSGVIYDEYDLKDYENADEIPIIIEYVELKSFKDLTITNIISNKEAVNNIIKSHDGELTSIYTPSPIIAAKIAKGKLKYFSIELIRKKPNAKIYIDKKIKFFLEESSSIINATGIWGLQLNPEENVSGKGIKIAMIDSGINKAHPDLSGSKVIAEHDFVNNDDIAEDYNPYGHGTTMSLIAAGSGIINRGVAYDSSLLVAKVGDQASQIINALYWTKNNGADVICMALGAAGRYAPLENAVRDIINNYKIPIIVAAGDKGPSPGTITTPGVVEEAITVGSVFKDDKIEPSSSRGPVDGIVKPDLVAPTGIITKDGGLTTSYGNSPSTALVSGAVALLRQLYPQFTPGVIKAFLQRHTVDLGYDSNTQGSGRLKLYIKCSVNRYDMDNGTCTYYCGTPSTSKCLGRHISDGSAWDWQCLRDGTSSATSRQQCWCNISCDLVYDGCEAYYGADYQCDEKDPGSTYCNSNCLFFITKKPDCEAEGGECMRGSGGCRIACRVQGKWGFCELGDSRLGYYPGCGERDCCCFCIGERTTVTTTSSEVGQGLIVTTTIPVMKGYNVRTVYLNLFSNFVIVIIIVVIMIGILFGVFRIIVKKRG